MVVDAGDAGLSAPAGVKTLGAKRAAIILLAFLLAQVVAAMLTSMLFGMYLGASAALEGSDPPDAKAITEQIQQRVMMPAAMLSMLLGAYVTYRLARPCFPGSISSGAFAQLGWVRSSAAALWKAAGVGLVISAATLALSLIFPAADGQLTGPLAQAAASPGWQRLAWALIALVIAPPSEEFIFRGVLYSGFSRSWGATVASVVVSVLFVALHLTETRTYWPALTGIALLAMATLVVRRTSGSLLPAIVLHATYNLVFVVFVYALSGQ